MEYLKIRRGERQRRADGSPYAVPLVVRKTRKYGETLSEKAISRKSSILVTGPHDSGKSRWVHRLHEHAAEIWGAKCPAAPLYLPALRPLGAWADAPAVAAWWEERRKSEQERAEAEELEPHKVRRPWTSLPAWQRSEALIDYVAEARPVVFVDDAHRLSGRKLDVARRCVLPAPLWVVSASQENRIPPNLRTVLLRREHQRFTLASDTAYDVTGGLVWAGAAALAVMGWWEMSMVVGGLQMFASGRRASRQD